MSAGVEFFEASAESCKGLSPAKFYDSAAGACVAVAVCTSPAVLDGAANLCNCPSPNIGTNGAAAPGDCAVPAPSVEVCGGLSPSQLYDAAADACVAASMEVCEGLIPSQFYDAAARECAAVAECDLPSVRNAGTNLCDCPAPNIGENGAVAPGVCAAPSAEVCGGENQFYAVTVFHGASLAACVEFVTCEAGATLNRAENGCECAGAATLNGAGTGCLCESPNEGTPGACAAPSADVCKGLNPEEFYDSTAGACVAAAVCALPAVRNAETNLCECPLGYSGDGGVCNADVTVSFSSPANGGLSAASGGGAIQNGGTVAHGTTVTFTASPASGYEVSIWTGVCAGAVGVFCEAVATADVSAGVEFFEAGAESCGRLIPAQFYDAAAKECVAVAAECDLPAVRRAGTNLCDCPAPNIGDDGAVAPGVCAAPSADVCGRENQFYAVTVFHGTPVSACVEFVTCETGATLNSAENRCECAGAAVLDGAGTGCLCESPNEGTPESCAAPSADVCGGLTPEEFYDAAAGACVAAAVCASPAVRNAGTNLCECPLGYSGDGAVCNADVTVSFSSPANGGLSAASGGGAIQNGGTVAHGTTVTFTASPASSYEVSIWTGVCAGAVGVFCEAVATADVSAGVEFFEASAESCKDLSPAKFYDAAAGECVAVAVCTSPAVLDGAANLCNCPAPNIGTNGAAAPGDCAVPAPSVEVCGGLSPSQLYDAAADACVAASMEVCEGLIPAQFYDAAARECAAVAECDLPSVRNAGTNLCDCPAPNIGENGAVAPGVCAAPSAEVCGGENQFYAVTVFHGASLAACVEFATCEAGATLNSAVNRCECAGAAVLNGAGTGCLCESPNEGTPGACAAPSAEVCKGLNPEQFYDAAAGACVAVADCQAGATLNRAENRCECAWDAVLDSAGTGCLCESPNVGTPGDCHAENSLHAAAGLGDLDVVNHFITVAHDGKSVGEVVNEKNGAGETPLHHAARNGHAAVVAALIAAGAEVNATDNVGFTPLHQAALSGHVFVVLTLIAEEADVNMDDDRFGFTSLHQAANKGHVSIVSALIAADADVNARTKQDRTPLWLADVGGRADVVAVLIAEGGHYGEVCANPAAVNPAGRDPSCVCAPPNVERKGACFSQSGDLGELSDDVLCVAFGGTVQTATGGGEVCSGTDKNGTFCIMNSVDAFPCRGLFKHLGICNVKHNRPALNPFFCGENCGEKKAVGGECLP